MAGSLGARIAKWTAIALVLALGAGGVAAWVQRGDIEDFFLARNFTPSDRVVQIIETVDFTPSGERVFLASQPTVGGREDFGHWCANVDHAEEGHVLGCFADRRIRLFEVTDERLNGIVEVTAAHELLHATFARMPNQDKARLSKQLRNTYEEQIAGDSALEERMSVYAELSPAAFANELHSVLGTEVTDLPEPLETHYAKWIGNRAEIVEWYDDYHRVFTELSAEAEHLSTELETLRTDIEMRSDAYDEAVRLFNEDAAEFKARNERYEFSGNPALFEAVRGDLLTRQEELRVTLEGIQIDTARFNDLREQLMALNDVSIELNDVLNSQLPVPTAEPEAG